MYIKLPLYFILVFISYLGLRWADNIALGDLLALYLGLTSKKS